jgi:hypothetical protein
VQSFKNVKDSFIDLLLDDQANLLTETVQLFAPKAFFRQRDFEAGLPDGIFSNSNSPFGYILEGLGLEDDGIFYGHLKYCTAFLVYFMAILVHIFCGRLVHLL